MSLVLPVASSAVKLALDDTAYKAIAEQLDFGQKVIAATTGAGATIGEFMGAAEPTTPEHAEAIRAQGSNLREQQAPGVFMGTFAVRRNTNLACSKVSNMLKTAGFAFEVFY